MYPTVNIDEQTIEGPGLDAFLSIGDSFPGLSGFFGGFLNGLEHWWSIYSIFAMVLSLVFFLGFIYARIRFGEQIEIEQQGLRKEEEKWRLKYEAGSTGNSRWSQIQEHVRDDSPSAWRIAIIEADILLEETLTNAGYVGMTIGEKLKGANPLSFTTLHDAWEAHKVRNEIAHAGSDFVLTKKIAAETIVRFERVFREFGVI